MSAGLPKSHICRSFPTLLIKAGAEALEAELPHLSTVQGIARLITLVSHSPGRSIMSLLIRAAMESALQEAGCGPYPRHPEYKAVIQVASECICVFTTLQNLHHAVRTIYGDSKSGYGGTLWAVPYYGIGQGNGSSPSRWAVVSTPVFKMTKDEGFGFMYRKSIEGKEFLFWAYSFVDDTDIIQYVQRGEPSQVLATCTHAGNPSK
jgi:hypothetical protein